MSFLFFFYSHPGQKKIRRADAVTLLPPNSRKTHSHRNQSPEPEIHGHNRKIRYTHVERKSKTALIQFSDPYVKVYLICEGKRIKKKKTTVKKNTLSPVYNEALVFDVPADNIEDVCLVIKVIDYDRSVCCSLGFPVQLAIFFCVFLGSDLTNF